MKQVVILLPDFHAHLRYAFGAAHGGRPLRGGTPVGSYPIFRRLFCIKKDKSWHVVLSKANNICQHHGNQPPKGGKRDKYLLTCE
jgi:hypothetical protein